MSREKTILSALDDAGDLSVAFARYWMSLDADDLIPHRSRFVPESIPSLLANLGIHELVSPELLRLRLVGTSIVEDYGREITGSNYLDFVAPARRPKASRALHLVCEHPCAMVAHLRSTTASGQVLTRESVAFPMRNNAGTANLVYFCSTPAKERQPYTVDRGELRRTIVLDRQFIDIGTGVPDFRD